MKADSMIRAIIRAEMQDRKINVKTLSTLCGVGATTMYKKLNEPETMTIADIRQLSKVLKIPINTITENI
jgi:antitoxin component HigA of HigAB toxin-antitoxin module